MDQSEPFNRGRGTVDRLLKFSASLSSAAHQLAKPHPGLSIEAHELDLFHRIEVGRARVDPDARQKPRQFEVLQSWRPGA